MAKTPKKPDNGGKQEGTPPPPPPPKNPNYPSTTGNPSGNGRGNTPKKKK